MTSTVALVSGDIESVVLMTELLRQGHYVTPLYVGPEEVRTITAVHNTCQALGLYQDCVPLHDHVPGHDQPGWELLPLVTAFRYGININHFTVAVPWRSGNRLDFVEKVVRLAHGRDDLYLYEPFANLGLAEVIRMGAERNAPLGLTHNCLKGGDVHCGTCRKCRERQECFRSAHVQDPATYGNPS